MKRRIAWMLVCVMLITSIPVDAIAAARVAGLLAGMELEEAEEVTPQEESAETISVTAADEMPGTEVTETEVSEIEEIIVKETETETTEEISAQSEATDFSYTVLNGTYCEITGYTGTDSVVEIPAEIDGYIVQSIAAKAFQDNGLITSVVFPVLLETIGSNAFRGCTALEEITFLGNALTSIGERAFGECTSLTAAVVPQGITVLDSRVFQSCSSLTEVSLPETLTSIKNYAFDGCTGLEKVELPDSVVSISGYAFRNCTKLSDVKLSSGWVTTPTYNSNSTSSGEGSSDYVSPFAGCTALTDIVIPEGMTAIPKYAFRGMTAQLQITFEGAVESIGAYAFADCTGLKTITLQASMTAVGSHAFSGCTALETIEFSAVLTEIGSKGFYGCSSLGEIMLPDSLETIDTEAFEGCTALEGVVIPAQVTVLNTGVFQNCTGLKEITLPETLTTIHSYVFDGCTGLEDVELPDSVVSISGYAFRNCTKLSDVKLPSGWVTTLTYNSNNTSSGEGSSDYVSPFAGCTALTSVTIPAGMQSVPKYAFRGATALETVVFEEGVESIGNYGFDGCTGLKTVTLPETMETIGNRTFNGCTGLTGIVFPDSVQSLGSYAFYGCIGLTELEIPAGVTVLSSRVFEGCEGLTEVTLPETLTTICNYAFGTCTSLESIELPDSVTSISGRAFYNCSRLCSVKLPSGWSETPTYNNNSTSSGEGSSDYTSPFYGCSKLETVMIPETMTVIPKYAFRGMSSLKKIWIGEQVTQIGTCAFDDCSNLIIHGVAGSYAETYAADHSIPFSEEVPADSNLVLTGKILDEAGNGVANVSVSIYDLTEKAVTAQIFTDETGVWNYQKLTYGHEYLIRYYHPLYLFAEEQNRYTAETESTVLEDMTVQKTAAEAAPEASFTYEALNGTYCEITGYTGTESVLVIPDTIDGYKVQSIATTVFRGNTTITEVSLPNHLETLGTNVFRDCTALVRVRANNSLTTIGSYAFAGCTALTEVSLPNTLTGISEYTFYNCSSLERIVIPESVTTIASNAFENCTGLTEIVFPETLEAIRSYAFRSCSSLESMIIPDSVTTISSRAFYNCTELSDVTLSAGWTTTLSYNNNTSYGDGSNYYYSPFVGCSSLTSITIPAEMKSIPKHAFRGLTDLKTVVFEGIPESVESYAFFGCTGLTELTLPESVQTIGSYAFADCSSLERITLPETMSSIDTYAFSQCKKLSEIEISEGITTLEGDVFTDCSSLSAVTMPESLTAIRAYTFKGCSSLESIVIPDSVTSISSRAFYNCTKLSDVTLSAGWTTTLSYNNNTSYGDSSNYYYSPFAGCSSLTSITIPAEMKSIPKHAFRGQTALQSVVFEDGVETAGSYAFYGCTGLENVTWPDSLAQIATYAFSGCTKLGSILLPEMLAAIGSHAFDGCSGITSVRLPDSVTDIGEYAFSDCIRLTSVTIPDGITMLAQRTFDGCTGLNEITLPEGLTAIQSYAFGSCSALEFVVIPDSVTSISSHAFYNCTRLSEVKLSSGWTTTLSYNNNTSYNDSSSYYSSPFVGCSSLTSVIIPEAMTAIPKHAFREMTGLSKIWIGEQVAAIGDRAFDNCSALTIHGVTGSYAESYAAQNDIPFSTEILAVSNGIVKGMILDTDGNGVAGVSVGIYDQTEQAEVTKVMTDETGTWTYQRFVSGHTYLIRYYHPLYTFAEESVLLTIQSDKTILDTLTVQRNSVQTASEEDFTYTVLNGTYCSITGYSGTAEILAIPNTLGGYTVQEIENSAFEENETLKRVYLPEDLETIGNAAFLNCSNLESVYANNGLISIGSNAFGYCSSLVEAVLPNTLPQLGSYVFRGCSALTEITLPEGMETIPASAFEDCTGLKTVSLPDTLKTIRSYAFRDCISLEGIELPDSVTSISGRAFYNCTALSDVTLSAGWTQTPDYNKNSVTDYAESSAYYCSPFVGCSSLTEIRIPAKMQSIPKYAFRGLTGLVKVHMSEGESVETIESYAFYGCTGLTEMVLSSGVTKIDSYAFSGCTGLTDITFPAALAEIGSYAFSECTSLDGVTLPAALVSIGSHGFYNCSSLSGIVLPEQVTLLNTGVFRGCSALTEVMLPEGLTTICSYAFRDCIGLESIELPDSVTSISGRAFYNCTALTEVVLSAGWTQTPDYNKNSVTDYAESSAYYCSPFVGCSSLTEITIPAGMTSVPKYAFREHTALKTVLSEEGPKELGIYSFYGCTGLETVELPGTLETIGKHAFRGCSSLEEVTVPEGVTAILDSGFYGCTAMEQISLPETLVTIAERAFYNCSSLKSIVIPSQVQILSSYSLGLCTSLTEVTFPEGLTAVESYAFTGSSSLAKVVLPDSITKLGARAFNNCTALKNVDLPAGWTTVPDYEDNSTTSYHDGSGYYCSPFTGCSSLTSITIPDEMTVIPKHAFRAATALEEVVLHEKVTSVGTYAFYGCTALKSINLPEELTAIPAYGFYQCQSLSELALPAAVTTVGAYAYYDCIGLRTIEMSESLKAIGTSAFEGCDGVLSLVLNDGLATINNKAFANCVNLKAVEVSESVTTVGENVFDGCTKLTVYCYSGTAMHTAAEAEGYTFYLIDEHEHDFVSTIETEPTCTRGGSQILTCSICSYNYIDLMDPLGHTEGEWVVVPSSCTKNGVQTKTCTVCGAVTQRETILATGHDWSEWITEREATVLQEGLTARVCSNCQEREEIYTDRIVVDYTTDNRYGKAYFTVVDATTKEPVSGASIFISTETEGEITLIADEEGLAEQILPVGTVKASVYAKDYKVRNISLTILPGDNAVPMIGISTENLVKAELTTSEMTMDEMLEAGIDVNDPANQHKYKYELVLEFRPEIDMESISFYLGLDGLPVILPGPGYVPPIPPGDPVPNYDPPEEWDPLTPYPPNYIPVYKNSSENTIDHVVIVFPDNEVVTVYPVSERFFLIIHGEVRWLKEMYDVELLAINTSLTDTVEDLTAQLTLPAGLSLAKMVDGEQSLIQDMGSLAEGESKSTHWYVKGDQEGSYTLSATLRGTMMPFGDTFEYSYETTSPLKVYAGSAMHLTYYVPDAAFYGEDYTVRIDLENVSDKTLYNVTHEITNIEQFRETTCSDGSVEIEQYPVVGGTGSIFIEEFHPGDVIHLEVTTTILFQSKLIEHYLESMADTISGVGSLVSGFKKFQEGIEIVSSMTSWANGSSAAIDSFLKAGTADLGSKAEMAAELVKELNDLASACDGDPKSQITEAFNQMKDAGTWDEIQQLQENPELLNNYSDKELSKLLSEVKAAHSEAKKEDVGDFDPYDAIAAAIRLIPIRYVLTNSYVATVEEESTTVIPSTIIVEPVGARYFGVDNISAYVWNLVKACVGHELETPTLASFLGIDLKESIGYYDAVDYVKMVEEKAKQYNITATSSSNFIAYIERANTAARTAEEPEYELAINNESAVYDEEGRLHFTGPGILEVTALNDVDAVLCIEMEDGTVARYPMQVVEAHECSSETWEVAFAPNGTESGFRAKRCDICDEIIDMEEMIPCENHEYADYTEERSPMMESVGVDSRTCIHCGCAEYEYSDAYSLNGYIYRFASGTTVEEIIEFFAEKGMEVSMDDFTSTEWAATGYTLDYDGKQYQIVISGDTDGDAEVTVFDLLQISDHVNEEEALTGAGLEASLSDIYESEPTIFDVLGFADVVNEAR